MKVNRSDGRKSARRFAGALSLCWAVVVAYLLVTAASELREGQRAASAARENLDPAALVNGRAAFELGRAHDHFAEGRRKLRSPAIAPLRLLPVLGRQIRSADALALAAGTVASAGASATEEVAAAVHPPPESGPERLRAVGAIAAATRRTSLRIGAIRLGPERGLVEPLARARARLAADTRRAAIDLRRVEMATGALEGFLRGPRRYLLVASNNAEMRAGSGMFLSIGVLEVADGTLRVGEMRPSGELRLPPPGVPLAGDLEARWGWTEPGREWRSLAMTPRFEATAPLAADLWQANTGETVDGVLALDVPALAAVLGATGPVDVGATAISADNVFAYLFRDQYEGLAFDQELDTRQERRREQLGEIARATVGAVEAGDIDMIALAGSLSRAAAGRHVLVWSSRPDDQAGWEAADVSGQMSGSSLLVAALNRGGNKLDQYLELDNEVRFHGREDGGTDVEVTVRATNTAPDGLSSYIAGPHPDVAVPAGTYVGLVAVTVPGEARGATFGSGVTAVVTGADGPTRVVASNVSIPRGEQVRLVVSFTLPAAVKEIVVEPSARVPASSWRGEGRHWEDDQREVLPIRR